MYLCKYILMIMALLLLTLPAFAQEFARCDDCHAQTLERDRMKIYQHQPFLQQECRSCHSVPDEEATQPTPERPEKPSGVDRRRVTWLEEGAVAATEHAFVLPADKLGEKLLVEARDEEGGSTHTELPVPPLVEVMTVVDDDRPPVISDVQVLEVRRGVFLSVTIGWNTDTLTNARVDYGLEEMSQSVGSGGRFGSRHQIVLNQLQPRKTYNFKVVSRDLYGREQESPSLSFSTKRAVTRSKSLSGSMEDSGPEVVSSNFQRLGSDYLVSLRLETPATVYVGRKGAVRAQATEKVSPASDESSSGDVHADLSGGEVLTIHSCRSCHQKKTAATHPVGVLPKSGMVIPPEYPTLPDGRISCISCHAVHGSNNEYLARKPGRRDLCVGCHQDML